MGGRIKRNIRLKASFPEYAFLDIKYLNMQFEYNEINFHSLDELGNAINAADRAYMDFILTIEPEKLNRIIPVDSFTGTKKWSVTFLLFNCINHSTHHRGQISQILDELRIYNDWSGLLEADILEREL